MSALCFFRLFLPPVSLAVEEVSAVVAASAAFFLDLDFLVVVVVVSEADAWSSAVLFLAFFDFFLVVVSVVWSPVLAWGFASAGAIASAKSRSNPAVHVVILTGSLVIRVLDL